MIRKYFGTDGIRGVANEKLTPELAFQLGSSAGLWLLEQENIPNRAVLGRDTRRSGPMLGAAMAAGFCAVGIDVLSLGVVPTPTVSFVTRKFGFGIGAVISASHNPAPDNGIKLVDHEGRKLVDDAELLIEGMMEKPLSSRPVGALVGSFEETREYVEAYKAFLVSLLPERLDGMTLAMDGANGAAYEIAPDVLSRLGATILLSGVSPDGMNINANVGATKPENIQKLTVDSGAEAGVAFDGDADRAVFSDSEGRLINGDQTMGIWASHQKSEGRLTPPVVIGTVMSNGGFERHLHASGIELVRAPVGDKYVAHKIEEHHARIGGEQSGHIIFPEHGPTGDGLVTMLEFLRVLRQSGRGSNEAYDEYVPWPQVLVNITLKERNGWQSQPEVAQAMIDAEAALGGRGRLNIRPSGTQPILRIMVEANEFDLRDEVTDRLVSAFERELGATVYSRVDLTYALGD